MAGSAVAHEPKPRCRGSVRVTDQPNMLARRGGHDGRQLVEHGKPDEIMSTMLSAEQHGSREWAKLNYVGSGWKTKRDISSER
jgi:hypothetical protein